MTGFFHFEFQDHLTNYTAILKISTIIGTKMSQKQILKCNWMDIH